MKYWTTEERRTAIELRDGGMTISEIGKALGRNESSVRSMFTSRRGTPYVATGRPRETTLDQALVDAAASERLRVATLWALIAYSNDNGVSVPRAAHILLDGVAA